MGSVLSDIQQSFGFRCYYVLDTSRLAHDQPVSFLYPSNIAASFFFQLNECLANYASNFILTKAGLGPVRCDLAEAESLGRISSDAAEVFRAAGMLRGATFPALGISGAPRLIGFSGNRPHLDIEDIESLNVIMCHAHARLTVISGEKSQKRQPLSELERQVLFLTADGGSFEAIAAKTKLSSITIGYLVSSICRKLEVATIEHAVALMVRRGISA